MGRRFVRDPGFERALFSSRDVRDVLEDRVSAAASRAATLAADDPRSPSPDLHTSTFGDVDLGAHGYRGRVGDTDYKARWFEEGSARQAPRPFLRPAVEQEIGPVEAGTGSEE